MNLLEGIHPDGGIVYVEAPEKWEELSRKQFAEIAPYIFKTDVLNLIPRMACIILGKKQYKTVDSDESWDEMIHAFAFVAQFPVLQKSHYKGFKLFGTRYFGIDDKLMGMTIKDFGLLEQTLANFDNKLNQRIFYETVYKRGIFKYIPLSKKKKAALRLNYQAIRGCINAMYPRIKSSGKEVSPDYHALVINISGTIFGHKRQTEKAELHDVLKYLEEQQIKYDEQKQELRNQRNA